MLASTNTWDYISAVPMATALIALSISIIAILINVWLAARQRAAATFQQYLQLELKSAKGQSETDLKVAFLLLLTQDVLNAFPRNKRWRSLMKDQLIYYVDDLRRWKRDPEGYVAHYGPRVDRLGLELINSSSLTIRF